MSIGIVVATYGSDEWYERGQRALRSAREAGPDECMHIHEEVSGNLAEIRNRGAADLPTDWVIFLDGDDLLERNYVSAMRAALDGDAIYKPSTQGFHSDGTFEEVSMIPERELLQANHIVIGAMVSRQRFLDVGGFDPSLPLLEDWDLWLRLYTTGSGIVAVPDAIYQIGVRTDSRNLNASHPKVASQIRKKYRKR